MIYAILADNSFDFYILTPWPWKAGKIKSDLSVAALMSNESMMTLDPVK